MIVLTGASGFVGQQLAPALRELGLERLLLVSRDAGQAAVAMPDYAWCSYDELATRELAGAVVIHLATRNNNQPGTRAEFDAANVDHLLSAAALARARGAVRFVNLCSTHALTPGADDAYGQSKAEGARQLAAAWPDGVINLYLPTVHGDRLQGKLAMLNPLPRPLRGAALALLQQAKPMISIDTLAKCLKPLVDPAYAPGAGDWRSAAYAADPQPSAGLYVAMKRSIDLIAALGLAIFLGWAMLLLALYIRLDSRGPALFAQARVGQGGRVFTCYKFRTMQVGTPQLGTHDVSASAITRAGAFLRRTKLDELPQIVNILRNEMSLVGPRPGLPVQTALIAARAHRGVLALKPGITGLAQINDIDMSDPERLAAWDDRYGAYRTTMLDLVILLRTALGGGSGDRVRG